MQYGAAPFDYLVQKAEDPQLSAVLVLPSTRGKAAPWIKYLKGMQLLKQYIGRDRIFCDSEGKTIPSSRSMEVYYDPPLTYPAQAQAKKILAAMGQAPLGKMVFRGHIHQVSVVAMMDSGATRSVMDERTYKKLRLQLKPFSSTVEVAGKGIIHTLGVVRAPLRLGRFVKNVTFLVIRETVTGVGVILGEDFLKKEKVDLLYSSNEAFIASEGITVYPLDRGDIHTRSATLLTYLEVASGGRTQTEFS